MKEAIITDLNGRYIEPTLVADSVTGVFDRIEPVPQPEAESPQGASNDPAEPETVLVGYMVAVPLPDGLYEPIFDVKGYRAAPQPQQAVDGSSFWRNGLSDEEIEALKPMPQPSQTDVLGQELTQMKIKNIQQQSVIDGLGRELTQSRLDGMLQKKTVNSLGTELTKAKLEIIKLKGENAQ
ncbi:hypothetical protein [Paenibacillus alvei]|uniref:hypothetical protein n=1 Tax=Paenibacillus alvei TaxID=44250 RepID=UPI0018CDD89E|nr:hypothetical protein [Paenibacillus alvei]MBG9737082.1 hypothetical protein [Paenibacillus alvei]MBG9742808.1 hypothetical protein [Paenibacillus alvei]MBG9746175.1 hypothetical protein [Paenibacillus alvei]MCY9579717.1 hypothetical protein [Paenibacillus alvei]MCY9586370.1 hypothetical protein [Paenibacillus alvei]